MRLGVNNITSLSAKHYCYARDFHLLPWIQTLLVKSLSAGRLFINIADRGLFWAQTWCHTLCIHLHYLFGSIVGELMALIQPRWVHSSISIRTRTLWFHVLQMHPPLSQGGDENFLWSLWQPLVGVKKNNDQLTFLVLALDDMCTWRKWVWWVSTSGRSISTSSWSTALLMKIDMESWGQGWGWGWMSLLCCQQGITVPQEPFLVCVALDLNSTSKKPIYC